MQDVERGGGVRVQERHMVNQVHSFQGPVAQVVREGGHDTTAV